MIFFFFIDVRLLLDSFDFFDAGFRLLTARLRASTIFRYITIRHYGFLHALRRLYFLPLSLLAVI